MDPDSEFPDAGFVRTDVHLGQKQLMSDRELLFVAKHVHEPGLDPTK